MGQHASRIGRLMNSKNVLRVNALSDLTVPKPRHSLEMPGGRMGNDCHSCLGADRGELLHHQSLTSQAPMITSGALSKAPAAARDNGTASFGDLA
jgi:hypothetical protein